MEDFISAANNKYPLFIIRMTWMIAFYNPDFCYNINKRKSLIETNPNLKNAAMRASILVWQLRSFIFISLNVKKK